MKIWMVSIAMALLLALGLLGFGHWLLHSPAGTEWLLTRVLTTQGGRVSSIKGTLDGQLQLFELRIGWPAGQLKCEKIEMSMRLRQLFPLRLEIEQLQIEKLGIETQATEQAGQSWPLNWPELPWWLGLVDIDLQQFDLRDFLLQEQESEPFRIEKLQSRVLWRDQSLQLTQLVLHSPEFTIEGRFSLDFANSSLQSDLQVRHLTPDNGWQQLSLNTDLQADDEQLLFGPVNISLTDSQDTHLNIAGDLGFGAGVLQFRELLLQRPKRSGTLTATGSLHFDRPEIELNSRLLLNELDLQAETGQKIRLSGSMEIAGSLNHYRGNFKLRNQAEKPLDIKLSGAFSGGQQQVQLTDLQGTWLNGTIGGQAQVGWEKGWQVAGQVNGRNLDPSLLHEQLAGKLNLDLRAEINATEQGPSGKLTAQLKESLLHGQSLTGTAELTLDKKQLQIETLQLLGDGLQLQATGRLNEKINVSFRIERLEQLFTDWRGQLTGQGRISLLSKAVAGEFSARGNQLAYQDWQLASLQLDGATLEDQHHWRLALDGQQLFNTQTEQSLENLSLEATGALEQHVINVTLSQAETSLRTAFHGSWRDQSWQGSLDELVATDPRFGHWQARHSVPLSLSASRLQIDTLEVVSDGSGSLVLQGSFFPANRHAEGQIEWQQLNLGLLRPWLPDWDVAGSSSGSILLQMADEPSLRGELTLQGQVKSEKLKLDLQGAAWRAEWDTQGLQGSLDLQLADGSELEAQFSSPEKFALGWPGRGDLHVRGRKFAMSRLQPWMPPGLNLSGKLDWQTSAQWQVAQPWIVSGDASLAEGRFFWQDAEETITAELTAATLSWTWQDRLAATMELQLQERGTLDARLELPVSASFPLQLNASGPVTGELNARLRELGLLSILFPGRVQVSRGQAEIDLQLTGSWKQPNLQGDARLVGAGAFLPTLGIQLNDIEVHGAFDENQVELKTLQLTSAGGSLVGQGRMKLENWQPQDYRFQLTGERFQLFNLPELQVRVTPDLTIDGDQNHYRVRGSLTVPELLASQRKRTVLAENSPDLQIVDAVSPKERRLKLTHDIDVQLVLGDQVLVNSAGIDAKLEGRLRLQSNTRQEVVAFGEIHVKKGRYASFGVSLDINRGNLLFNGGPLDEPSLDILALRKAGEVQAGVKITGTPKQPVVQLYSEPSMPETDILSYIVLGRPMGADGSQGGLLMTAAGTLLSQGESVSLQEKLKSRLGLDEFTINAGDGDVRSSIITTGKYLSPDLYVSLGYSLFSNSNEVKVRYDLSPGWELESNIGTESGVDLFYKIDIQ